jgi:hypothetical protein
MTAAAVLAECRRRGRVLTATGDRLSYAGYERDVRDLRAALKAHQPEIRASRTRSRPETAWEKVHPKRRMARRARLEAHESTGPLVFSPFST